MPIVTSLLIFAEAADAQANFGCIAGLALTLLGLIALVIHSRRQD